MLKKSGLTKKSVFSTIIWIFLIGCFVGCMYETILHFFKNGYFESRSGVIYGPLNPVYGFGAVLFYLATFKLKKLKIVFLVCAFVGGFFEFMCSYLQEIIFGTISWDYSDFFLNIGGRTTVIFALFWGFLGLLFFVFVLPYINKFIESIPIKYHNFIVWVICLFLVFDLSISTVAAIRQYERRNNIKPDNRFEEYLDKKYPDSFMDKIYPNKMNKDKVNK